MKRAFLVALNILMAAPCVAGDEPSEAQQRLACMGDALRLCPQHIPNREQIIECLRARHDALSEGCRPVFDASLKARVARRRRGPS